MRLEIVLDLHGVESHIDKTGSPEDEPHDDAAAGLDRPHLVKHKVAQRVDDRYTLIALKGLHPVRMAADYDVGPGFDGVVGQLLLLGVGRVGVFPAPVEVGDDDVGQFPRGLDVRDDVVRFGVGGAGRSLPGAVVATADGIVAQ